MAEDIPRAMPVELTSAAREGWHAFAGVQGTTVTALMEILGRHLAAPSRTLAQALGPVAAEARALTAQRRRRSR